MIFVKVFHNSILNSCSYCIYDDTNKYGYIVDVGDVEPIMSFVTENRINIKGIYLTHSHFDHVYGLNLIANLIPIVPIYCSAETLCGLKDERINMAYIYLDDDFIIPSDERFTIINHGSVISCFSMNIEIISCSGHDDGCLSFIIGNNIFTGDSFVPYASVTYNWGRSSKIEALESEKKLFDLITKNGLNVYPGHYQK